MKSIEVRLSTIADVQEFVGIVARTPIDIDLCSGRYVVDAKSIMGIFSLDLSAPLELVIYGDHEQEVIEKIKKYIV